MQQPSPSLVEPASQISGPSEATSIVPVLQALSAAQTLLSPQGPALPWKPGNGSQQRVIDLYQQYADLAGQVSGTDAKAAFDIPLINRWLIEKGFSMQLSPLAPSPGRVPFATAAVLDLTVEWIKPGKRTTVDYQKQTYPAFTVKGASFFQVPGHPHPVACLATRSGHELYFTKIDQSPGEGLSLFASVVAMDQAKQVASTHYDGVTLPMVTLKQENDLSFMKGLSASCANGERAEIAEAVQQTKLRMNELGARAESAAAMGSVRSLSLPRPPYVFDAPFLTWWKQDAIPFPIFTALITPAVWSDPGALEASF